ncbi:unnamed protein product, partial [Adineta steineri]
MLSILNTNVDGA